MSETALYRKYRPKSFKEVMGQDEIVDVLQGSIKQGNIAHAYLFCGSRGTGKTTVARILAKAIGTSNNDLYEIDAASRNSVDEIRALNEAVNTLPYESKYKVYILDEVHMLSKAAFNAFLKTLEEPPSHVVFILATTEAEKLPETVVSRTQQFTFKKPSQTILKKIVEKTAKEEGYQIEAGGADLIALLGDGSFRDALGILQKIIGSTNDKKITLDEIEKVTGAPRGELVNSFVKALAEKDLEEGLATIKKAAKQNIDMKLYLKLILEKMRQILLLRYQKDLRRELAGELSASDLTFVEKLATDPTHTISSATLAEMLGIYDQIGRTHIPELPLELALIKLIEVQNKKAIS
ncbi:MAG TPA: DNA polymerase III subunit gamma/tau [Candidatus Paceibacterota bacterium]|nr:DNA polymerase III subunit gamma/tau [Candidatus Paceibacterota bacterium]